MDQDRKDIPATKPAKHLADELAQARERRKAHESRTLDGALKETFPTSGPVPPFAPAIRTEHEFISEATRRCGHAGCTCAITANETWCSEACRDQQQGYLHAHQACMCGHGGCAHSDISQGADAGPGIPKTIWTAAPIL
jgi:hypothetical protein